MSRSAIAASPHRVFLFFKRLTAGCGQNTVGPHGLSPRPCCQRHGRARLVQRCVGLFAPPCAATGAKGRHLSHTRRRRNASGARASGSTTAVRCRPSASRRLITASQGTGTAASSNRRATSRSPDRQPQPRLRRRAPIRRPQGASVAAPAAGARSPTPRGRRQRSPPQAPVALRRPRQVRPRGRRSPPASHREGRSCTRRRSLKGGRRSACRWCRRSRTSSTARHGSASRAPRSARSRGRTPDPALRG